MLSSATKILKHGLKSNKKGDFDMNFVDPIAKLLGEWSYDLGGASVAFRLGLSMFFAFIIF